VPVGNVSLRSELTQGRNANELAGNNYNDKATFEAKRRVSKTQMGNYETTFKTVRPAPLGIIPSYRDTTSFIFNAFISKKKQS